MQREVEIFRALCRLPDSAPCPCAYDTIGSPVTGLVMEWCPTDLERWWSETWKEHRAFVQLCEALAEVCRRIKEYAAILELDLGKKATHADIKPLNVLRSNGGRWLLTDFGASKIRPVEEENWAATRMILGTENFIAPEVLFNACKPWPTAMDTWAIGCSLFALLKMRTFLGAGAVMPVNGTHSHHFRSQRVALVADLQERKPALFINRDLDPSAFSSPEALPDRDKQTIQESMAGIFGGSHAALERMLGNDVIKVMERALKINPALRYRDPLELASELEGLADRYRELEAKSRPADAPRLPESKPSEPRLPEPEPRQPRIQVRPVIPPPPPYETARTAPPPSSPPIIPPAPVIQAHPAEASRPIIKAAPPAEVSRPIIKAALLAEAHAEARPPEVKAVEAPRNPPRPESSTRAESPRVAVEPRPESPKQRHRIGAPAWITWVVLILLLLQGLQLAGGPLSLLATNARINSLERELAALREAQSGLAQPIMAQSTAPPDQTSPDLAQPTPVQELSTDPSLPVEATPVPEAPTDSTPRKKGASTPKPSPTPKPSVASSTNPGLISVSGAMGYLLANGDRVGLGSVPPGTYELFIQTTPNAGYTSQGKVTVGPGERIFYKCGFGSCRRTP
jgi:serine/threonine protein kinase